MICVCVCVHACVHTRARVCVCVCVCVSKLKKKKHSLYSIPNNFLLSGVVIGQFTLLNILVQPLTGWRTCFVVLLTELRVLTPKRHATWAGWCMWQVVNESFILPVSVTGLKWHFSGLNCRLWSRLYRSDIAFCCSTFENSVDFKFCYLNLNSYVAWAFSR